MTEPSYIYRKRHRTTVHKPLDLIGESRQRIVESHRPYSQNGNVAAVTGKILLEIILEKILLHLDVKRIAHSLPMLYIPAEYFRILGRIFVSGTCIGRTYSGDRTV